MKILVAYASAGAGHKRCAEAIFELLKKEAGHQVALVDCLDYTFRLYKFFYSRGYAFLISHFPSVWGAFFKLSNIAGLIPASIRPRQIINKIISRKFIDYLKKEQFDCCICTQFLANEIVAYLKSKNEIRSRLICVVTDYDVHCCWYADGVDVYTVAGKETRERLIKLGIKADRIAITGIPVNSRFLELQDKEKLLDKLKLKSGQFTILAFTSTFGTGPLFRIVKELQDKFQLLVVSGNKKRLFDKLSRIKNSNTQVFRMVNNMAELMSVADLVITKPGGLTISEALVKHLPMLFISAIPGQEVANANLMVRYNVGFWAEEPARIKELVSGFYDNPDSLKRLKDNAARLSKPSAGREVIALINPLHDE